MPHRDPETGQFVGGSGGGVSYSDHDIHHVRHSLDYEATADAGPNLNVTDVRDWEITERGLDPDEIAELVALRFSASLTAGNGVIQQDEIGGWHVQIDSGYNLDGDEFVSAAADSDGIDTDGSGTDDFTAFTNDTDEVGQLTTDTLGAYAGYSDTSDGTGGAAGLPQVTYLLPMASTFGSGPYVDAADDFTTRIRMEVENMVAGARVEAFWTLYYDVDQLEGGRGRFGRP